MWATRSVVQAGVELVGNPAPGGLSINPRLRHIHGQDSTYPKILKYSRAYPKTHPIMSRWVYALTFLRSVLGIKAEIVLSLNTASVG